MSERAASIALVMARGYDYAPEDVLDMQGRLTPAEYWDGEDVNGNGGKND